MAMTIEQTKSGELIFKGRALNSTKAKNDLLAPLGKQLLNYGAVLVLLPSVQQAEQFRQVMGCARVVRNDYLDTRIKLYQDKKLTLSVAEYKKVHLSKLKDEKPFLREVDKFALEAAVEAVDNAYKNFFEHRAGFPKFVSKYKPNGNAYTTKTTNNNIKLVVYDGVPAIQLPKIDKPVRIVLPSGKAIENVLPSNARITSVTVKRTGKVYTVSLKIEAIIDKIAQFTNIRYDDIVAIDVGVKDFCHYGTKANKTTVDNPRWIKLHEKRLSRFQKALSRKMYDRTSHTGSKNYYKALAKVHKEHTKTRNQRKDFHHKLSRKIADSCKVFVCEDLNIKGMMANRHMSKSIASVGWGRFLTFVKYKLERKGGYFIKVDRWFPSSQLCHSCGYKNVTVKDLLVRSWTCPQCGTYHDRDDNAVDNLINEGINTLVAKYKITIAA